MQLLAIQTPILKPPQDDLFVVLADTLGALQDNDVLLISSKVVSIGEGNTIKKDAVDKTDLIKAEADFCIPRDNYSGPLAIRYSTFIGSAGVDESNGDEHYVLLPKNAMQSAKNIHSFLIETFKLNNIGVIITDSHSSPMRYGVSGVALGWWGIKPLRNHIGRLDLFGREFKFETSNIVDSLAAGANLVMGETNERTPLVIARNAPQVEFVTDAKSTDLFSSPEEDLFGVLYRKYLP